MPASHLVARLDAALDGKIHFDHFEHARGEVVACRNFLLFLFEAEIEFPALLLEAFLGAGEFARRIVVVQSNLKPLVSR